MELPKRKHPRLKDYDYSLPGYYYVTIHIEKNAPWLSRVGRGLAPAGAVIHLTAHGKIVQKQLLALEHRFTNVKVDKYVIMPTHVHAILQFTEFHAGDNRVSSLMDVIRAFKSLATRECNQVLNTPGCKLFQTSFYETILRNETAYQKAWQYIDQNPEKWFQNPEDI